MILNAYGVQSNLDRYHAIDDTAREAMEHLCDKKTCTPSPSKARSARDRLALVDHFRNSYKAIVAKDMAALIEIRKSSMLEAKSKKAGKV